MIPALLSLVFPGLGQAFNGQRLRGLVFLLTCWLALPWVIAPIDAYLEGRKVALPLAQRLVSAGIFLGIGVVIVLFGVFASLPR